MIEYLINLGLTEGEAKTYLSLIKLKNAKTGKICKDSGVKSSHIYDILTRLQEKGLVSYKLANNIKIYYSNDPSSLLQLYKEKEEKLHEQKKTFEKTIKKLKSIQSSFDSYSNYKYFEGIKAIKAMWEEINKKLKPNSEAKILISTLDSWKSLNLFYLEHHKIRVAKAIKEKMIMPEKSIKLAKQREKIGLIEIRNLPLKNQSEFAIYGNLVVIQDTSLATKTPRAFLIDDAIFADMFSQIFDNLWKQSKK